jgi:ketosteroid isomerase-like protein
VPVSQEDLELLRQVIERWNRGERDDMSAFHPDVEWLPLRASTEGAYRGHAGIHRFVADTEREFETFELRVEALRVVGERVLAWGTIHFRARQSGVAMDQPVGGVVEFRDDKILRWEDFGSKEQALSELGLA